VDPATTWCKAELLGAAVTWLCAGSYQCVWTETATFAEQQHTKITILACLAGLVQPGEEKAERGP